MAMRRYNRRAAQAGLAGAVINAGYRNRAVLGQAARTIGRAAKKWLARRRQAQIMSAPVTQDTFMSPASTRQGIQHGRVVNEGTGGQCSYFRMAGKKSYIPPHILDSLPPQVYQLAFASQLKSAVGLQNVTTLGNMFIPSMVTAYTSDTVSRVVFESGTMDVTMNNIFLSNAYVIIYDIVARKDCAVANVQDPLSAWVNGDINTGATSAYTKLGSTPFQTELFNQYYRVAQQTDVVLAAGATHVHKARLKSNRQISAAYATNTPYAIKDLSYFCMIEVHGSPANDITTQTQVSVGQAGLNIIVDSEVHLKQLSKATPTITVTNTLATSFTNGEQVVNLGGSTITTNAEG